MECVQVIFTGRVQGVGFRQTTKSIAENFSVVGYVKNLNDGTVELVVQSEEKTIEAFLTRVGERMSGYIERTEKRKHPEIDATDFRIALGA